MILDTAMIPTPIGPLVLFACDRALCGLDFAHRKDRVAALRRDLAARFGSFETRSRECPAGVRDRIDAYFAGDVSALDPVEVDVAGTPFQERVWRALRRIPAGRTRSYAEIAAGIDAPRAVRAVGSANARNPVSLVIPCHRVIASDGTLGGYGGGLERKRWLLEHEAAAVGSAGGLAGACRLSESGARRSRRAGVHSWGGSRYSRYFVTRDIS